MTAFSQLIVPPAVIFGNYEREGLVRALDTNSKIRKRDVQPKVIPKTPVQVLIQRKRMDQSEQTGRKFAAPEALCRDIWFLGLARI